MADSTVAALQQLGVHLRRLGWSDLESESAGLATYDRGGAGSVAHESEIATPCQGNAIGIRSRVGRIRWGGICDRDLSEDPCHRPEVDVVIIVKGCQIMIPGSIVSGAKSHGLGWEEQPYAWAYPGPCEDDAPSLMPVAFDFLGQHGRHISGIHKHRIGIGEWGFPAKKIVQLKTDIHVKTDLVVGAAQSISAIFYRATSNLSRVVSSAPALTPYTPGSVLNP